MCGERNTGLFPDGMTEKKRGTISGGDDEVSDVLRIAQSSVGVFSIWFFLSGSFCLFVILLPLVSTAELRVDEFPVDERCGRSLYIGGVDRLGERISTSTSSRALYHCANITFHHKSDEKSHRLLF
jgi:hypothetical protein